MAKKALKVGKADKINRKGKGKKKFGVSCLTGATTTAAGASVAFNLSDFEKNVRNVKTDRAYLRSHHWQNCSPCGRPNFSFKIFGPGPIMGGACCCSPWTEKLKKFPWQQ